MSRSAPEEIFVNFIRINHRSDRLDATFDADTAETFQYESSTNVEERSVRYIRAPGRNVISAVQQFALAAMKVAPNETRALSKAIADALAKEDGPLLEFLSILRREA